MFGGRLVEAFARLKATFDHDNRMNPGKVVAPYPLDANLRLGGDWRPRALGPVHFSYPDDGGSFAQAANRCVGVGRCRQRSTAGGTVMCPSYQVTLEDEHSTRDRARLLFEMLDGHGDGPIEDGWRSDAVRDALDLCLSCKGCRSDCPVNVDMATYKAEFLSHHWKGRLRPRSAYALGWLPAGGHAVTRLRLAPVANTVTQRPRLRRLTIAAAGIEPRPLPRFAGQTLQRWAARRPPIHGTRGEVLLWPDTFTNPMHPHVGRAAVDVLEDAGWAVTVPREPPCCGLTWISTGQLASAKRILRQTAVHLAGHVHAGGLVVGLEPSCTTVFRSDAPELLPDDGDVARLAEQTVTLAELLTEHTPGWVPPQLDGDLSRAIVQVHCHQHAALGWDADARLLSDCGVQATRLDRAAAAWRATAASSAATATSAARAPSAC
jgi:Fe-S oxidoreductase